MTSKVKKKEYQTLHNMENKSMNLKTERRKETKQERKYGVNFRKH